MKNPIKTNSSFRALALPVAMALLAVCLGRSAIAAESQAGLAPEQQRLELMKSKGPDGTLTILPVRLAGKPWDRVTEVVGVLLEQQGLRNIELGKTAFTPAATNWESLATNVGAFVKTNPITTGYALYAEYNGDHKTGLNELRAVVVDQTGAVVWTDFLTMQDEALKKNRRSGSDDLLRSARRTVRAATRTQRRNGQGGQTGQAGGPLGSAQWSAARK